MYVDCTPARSVPLSLKYTTNSFYMFTTTISYSLGIPLPDDLGYNELNFMNSTRGIM